MISKEYFVEILNKLKTADDLVNDINNRIRSVRQKLDNDFVDGLGMGIYHDNLVVDLLDKMFDTDMISYWVYELYYGRDYKDGCIQDADGTNIDISTAEKLYDYLINNNYPELNIQEEQKDGVNTDIKKAIFENNVKKWEIANKLGISDSSFSRILRTELSFEKKIQILNIIKGLAKENKNE